MILLLCISILPLAFSLPRSFISCLEEKTTVAYRDDTSFSRECTVRLMTTEVNAGTYTVKWWRGVQVIANDDIPQAARVAATLETVGLDPEDAENTIIKTTINVTNIMLEDGGKYKCQVTGLTDSSELNSDEDFLLIQILDVIDPILWRSSSSAVSQEQDCKFESSAFPTDLTPVTLEWVDSTGTVLDGNNQPPGVQVGNTETSYDNVEDTETGYSKKSKITIDWASLDYIGLILTCRVSIAYPESKTLSEVVHISDLCGLGNALGALSCEECAAGTWSAGGEAAECTACEGGKTVDSGSGFSAGDCACGAGTMLDITNCDECAVGEYSPGGSATSCSVCPTGSAAPRGAAAEAECMCLANHVRNSNTNECEKCEKDSFNLGGAASECFTCDDVNDSANAAELKQQPLYKELCGGARKLISYLSLIVALFALLF